jgi:hypothetical protein
MWMETQQFSAFCFDDADAPFCHSSLTKDFLGHVFI